MSRPRRCILLHGAGSTPEFVERAFGAAMAAGGWQVLAPDVRGADMTAMVDIIASHRPGATDLIGGVSLGAHAAASYAATTGYSGRLLAVMPAWIGRPGPVAALTSSTADLIEHSCTAQVLADIARATGEGDWILAELRRAWTSMPQQRLVTALRVAAEQPAPKAADLTRIVAATQIVALRDDPTHPLAVALAWHTWIPGAELTILPRDLGGEPPTRLAADLSALSGSR